MKTQSLSVLLFLVLVGCQKSKISPEALMITGQTNGLAGLNEPAVGITLKKANNNFAILNEVSWPGNACNYGCCMFTYAKSPHQSGDANTFVDCLDNAFSWGVSFTKAGGDGSANRPPRPDPFCPLCYTQPNATDAKLIYFLGLSDQSSRDEFNTARDLIAPFTAILLHAITNPKASTKEKMLMVTDYYTKNYITTNQPLSTDAEYFLFAYSATLFSPEMVLRGDHALLLFGDDLGEVNIGTDIPTGAATSVTGNLGIPVNFAGGVYEPPLPGLGIAIPK